MIPIKNENANERPTKTSAAHIDRALLSISALAIFIMGVGAFLISYHILREQALRHLQTLISFTASQSQSAIEFRDERTALDILQSIPEGEGVSLAEIQDASGTALAHIDARTDDALGRFATWVGSARIDQDVVVEGRVIGRVVLEGGSAPMLRVLQTLLFWFPVGMLLVGLCALLFARIYTRRFTHPIRQLRTFVMQLIENRDFSQRAPPSSLAEVEDLRLEFNTLLDEIGLRDRLLLQSNALLRRLAYLDALTNLPNRAMFEQTLQKTVEACDRDGTRACLFYIDVDAFKSINDNLGHAAGDALLVQIADRLRVWRPQETTATRLGGDEFVVLLAPLDDMIDPTLLAVELRSALAAPLHHGGCVIYPSTSIGTAIYPDATRDMDEFVSVADHAMYAAKNQRHLQGRTTHWQSVATLDTPSPTSDLTDSNPSTH